MYSSTNIDNDIFKIHTNMNDSTLEVKPNLGYSPTQIKISPSGGVTVNYNNQSEQQHKTNYSNISSSSHTPVPFADPELDNLKSQLDNLKSCYTNNHKTNTFINPNMSTIPVNNSSTIKQNTFIPNTNTSSYVPPVDVYNRPNYVPSTVAPNTSYLYNSRPNIPPAPQNLIYNTTRPNIPDTSGCKIYSVVIRCL